MKNRPNIVVLVSDQQHAAYAANPAICPTIAEFFDKGAYFPNAFTPTPICTPARASMQTGLLPHQHKLIQNTHNAVFGYEDLPEGTITVANRLGDLGYRCGYAGKWHVGKNKGPAEHGYHDTPKTEHRKVGQELESMKNPVFIPGVKGWRGLLSGELEGDPWEFEPTAVGKTAAEMIDSYAATPGQPFFLFASTLDPHVPCVCPESVAAEFPPEQVALPEGWNDPRRPSPYSWSSSHNYHNLCKTPAKEADMRRFLSHYKACNRMVDMAFGRILEAIARNGIEQNTIVIFTSDHGDFAGEHGLIGKGVFLNDCLVRVPLGIRIPNERPRNIPDTVTLCDLFATLLDAVEDPGPVPPSSRSLLPAIRGEQTNFPDFVVTEHHGTIDLDCVLGIRTPEFSYIYRASESDELYALAEDPLERTNRIDDPKFSAIIAQLQRQLLVWAEETADPTLKGMRCAFDKIES